MTPLEEARKRVELKPCPFCGSPAEMERDSDHHGEWFNLGCSRHWGRIDRDEACPGGRLWYTADPDEEQSAIAAWNSRALPSGGRVDREAVAALDELQEAVLASKGTAEDARRRAALKRLQQALALSPPPAESVSPEDKAEAFIQAAIDSAPEPLRRLGEYLTHVLDEDRWATAERLLLGVATTPPAEGVGELVEAGNALLRQFQKFSAGDGSHANAHYLLVRYPLWRALEAALSKAQPLPAAQGSESAS